MPACDAMRAQVSPRATTQVPFGPGPGTSVAVGVTLGGRWVAVGTVAAALGEAVGGRGVAVVTLAVGFGVRVDGGSATVADALALPAAGVADGGGVVDGSSVGAADAVGVDIGAGVSVWVGVGAGVLLATGVGCVGSGCNTTSVMTGRVGVTSSPLATGDARNLNGSL